jgi:phage shock protein A
MLESNSCFCDTRVQRETKTGAFNMADRFADVMQKERDRLHREREQVSNQQQELEDKVAQIDRELEAIDAYEAAKSGKAKINKRSAAARGPARRPRARPQARRGSRREALFQVIRENPDGLRRGEILERMGLKGDKAGEMSVSNALTALTKSNQVSRHEGKYVPQGG